MGMGGLPARPRAGATSMQMVEVLEDRLEGRPVVAGRAVFGGGRAGRVVGLLHADRFGILPDSATLSALTPERCLARPAYKKALARDAEWPT